MPERGVAPLATCAVVLGMAAATYSVVRYRPAIVLGYSVLAVVLSLALATRPAWAGRSRRIVLDRWAPAAALTAAAAVTWLVPAFTYLSAADALRVRLLLAIAA
ncbi:MAG: hypothetical protein WAL50_13770, partial [Kineosporiaceae bacterium]